MDDWKAKVEWLGGPIERCTREGHEQTPREWCQDCQRAGRVLTRTLQETIEKIKGVDKHGAEAGGAKRYE